MQHLLHSNAISAIQAKRTYAHLWIRFGWGNDVDWGDSGERPVRNLRPQLSAEERSCRVWDARGETGSVSVVVKRFHNLCCTRSSPIKKPYAEAGHIPMVCVSVHLMVDPSSLYISWKKLLVDTRFTAGYGHPAPQVKFIKVVRIAA